MDIIQNIFSNHNEMKLEINNRRKTGKFTNMWKINYTLLTNQWVKEYITREIRKHLETNENENTTYQNLQEAVKAVLRRKFIAINAYIKTRRQKREKDLKSIT